LGVHDVLIEHQYIVELLNSSVRLWVIRQGVVVLYPQAVEDVLHFVKTIYFSIASTASPDRCGSAWAMVQSVPRSIASNAHVSPASTLGMGCNGCVTLVPRSWNWQGSQVLTWS